jgi:hypothetical protein
MSPMVSPMIKNKKGRHERWPFLFLHRLDASNAVIGTGHQST